MCDLSYKLIRCFQLNLNKPQHETKRVQTKFGIRKPKVGIIAEGTVTATTSHGAYIKGESLPNDRCTQGKFRSGLSFSHFLVPI